MLVASMVTLRPCDNVIGWSNLQSVDIHKWFNQVAGVGFSALLVLIIKVYGTLNLKPSELMATLRNNAKLADFSAQLSFRYKFAIEFNAAAQALRTSTNPGLVIFIDDLDRCGPENLMAVLELINFLTTAGPCFILLGMDEPKIIEIVAQQYGGDRERARQYLKKLINLTVPVPEINEANSLHRSGAPALAGRRRGPFARVAERMPRLRAGDPAISILAILIIVLLIAWRSSVTKTGCACRRCGCGRCTRNPICSIAGFRQKQIPRTATRPSRLISVNPSWWR